MKANFTAEKITADILIVGGGTAGCYAASKLKNTALKIVIAEKANISRSGCLAAGVNALNAYISKGHTPSDYVEYMRRDAAGIIRDDLALSMCERLNEVTADLEKLGLVILKDEQGEYVTRGWRNVKINGENIKPLLASAAKAPNVTILNNVNITDLKIVTQDKQKIVTGTYGFSTKQNIYYDIDCRAVLVATGGASGLYRPNNPGFSRHKMWYSPFNAGSGYAMGIRAGAELTTLEQRFIALRCKDTIAPTGTIAQGVHARQVNSCGVVYENKYGLTTPERIYGTVEENRAGRGPCYLDTTKIDEQAENSLLKAYLNMAPSQTLKWIETGLTPRKAGVEIEGTEPYIVGGHTGSGYWVDTDRETTIRNLFAAGDVAGGAPQKYVTGALAEAEIAAETILKRLQTEKFSDKAPHISAKEKFSEYDAFFNNDESQQTYQELTEAMQKIMDEYAGGIAASYRYNDARLQLAASKIAALEKLAVRLAARDSYELMKIYELRDRITTCRALIKHLQARHETRWHTFGENLDYLLKSSSFEVYVNSVFDGKDFTIRYRPLVKEARYEHQN